ncbi:alpha/beta hydrolase [Diaphorobacter sp. HDW4B]|uniref:alpha/beta fold hydrolase n=1 Tax=Diaphorobacter sp. HDW4B TaxID=2714925 RepID=UPI00140C4FD8|nr:alpha/beta hydrolase [Diaphorobacter sp. HDW4B]QIL69295.1 alpha/beta hydrolase [Diaphorobacter sp. HDW4B]
MYTEKRPARQLSIPVRTLRYHVRVWGDPDAQAATALPPLVMVHGWMDVGASYQFVVDAFSDAFAQGRLIIAPDWRGFGHSMPEHTCDHYVFADYLADLDRLLDHFSPNAPVDLVGHSMGGNVSMMYAGARPERIRRLVNLEGFGMAATRPAQAPERYARWLNELREYEQGGMDLKPYDSVDGVALRLMKTNPRISADKAQWLAQHWAAPDAQGRWHILGSSAHKIITPMLFRADEMLALYEAIKAPVLSVEAEENHIGKWSNGTYSLADFHQRLAHVPNARSAQVMDAAHMLHHDQPEAVARLIEAFLA